MTTLTSDEFDRDIPRAMQAATEAPVFITELGRPAHVLLSYAAYERLRSGRLTPADAIGGGIDDDGGFDPPRLGRELFEPPDLD